MPLRTTRASIRMVTSRIVTTPVVMTRLMMMMMMVLASQTATVIWQVLWLQTMILSCTTQEAAHAKTGSVGVWMVRQRRLRRHPIRHGCPRSHRK